MMFMKHYAPNRCFYIKVAKLRTGVGSAETKLQFQNYPKSTSKSKFAKGDYSKKQNNFFFRFSPIDQLIILYQLTKFEAPGCYLVQFSRYHDYKFSKSKSAKGDNLKKIKTFFEIFINEFPHHPLSAA